MSLYSHSKPMPPSCGEFSIAYLGLAVLALGWPNHLSTYLLDSNSSHLGMYLRFFDGRLYEDLVCGCRVGFRVLFVGA